MIRMVSDGFENLVGDFQCPNRHRFWPDVLSLSPAFVAASAHLEYGIAGGSCRTHIVTQVTQGQRLVHTPLTFTMSIMLFCE